MPRSMNRSLDDARRMALIAALSLTAVLAWTASASAQFCQKPPCPEPDIDATEGFTGSAHIDRRGGGLPLRQRGLAGGPVDAPTLPEDAGGPCAGVIGVLPDHVLTFRGDLDHVWLQAHADEPVALVMLGPTGWTCSGPPNDDASLYGTFAAGTWRIWVASEAPGLYPAYTLEAQVHDPAAHPARPGDVRPGTRPGTRPDPRPGSRPDRARPIPRDTSPEPPHTDETHHPRTRPDRHGDRPRRDRDTRETPTTLAFHGRFEDLDVRFEGPDINALHAECTAFTARSTGLDWVDDIVIHGTAHRKPTGWWSPEALCAIAALNARPTGATRDDARAHGKLEEAPFEVHGTPEHLRSTLTRFLPIAVDMAWADDLEVNGQTRRNRTGYWNIDEVVMLVLSLSAE